MIYLTGAVKKDGEALKDRKDIGVLLTFRSAGRTDGRTQYLTDSLWAADNGCFTNPNIEISEYLAWLETLSEFAATCLFATAPDIVGDAAATWERSQPILPKIRAAGFAAALVAQDGIEDRPIAWDEFDCLFIGGSTEWKLSSNTFWLCREAIKQGKWVHMGRVNSMRRLLQARFAGCNSADGTFLAFGPDINFPKLTSWLDFIDRQPTLGF